MFGQDDLVKNHRSRANFIGNLVLICFGIILARLWYLQIFQGEELYQWSLQNRLRKEIVKAPRGMVYTTDNELIVDNVPRFDAVITPQYLTDRKVTLKRLGKILDMSEASIKKILQRNSRQPKYKPIIVKKNISRKEVALIETENSKVPGVSVETFISREYLDKEIGAHVLGYISEIRENQLDRYKKRDKFSYKLGDFIGQFGLEEEYDLKLRGKDGFEFVEVDALGRKKRHINSENFLSNIQNKPVVPGSNVRLTIDRNMQEAGYKALEGKVGSVVAIDIKTGEILTMVSRPAFDPSQFSRGITSEYWQSLVTDENNPLRDRSIQEHYPPGSTFKAITGIAALEEGVVDEHTEVNCTGRFVLGRRPFHCWKRGGHGKTKIYKALRESCNVYFYKIATRLGIDTLAKYATALGLGQKTGVNLPREISGLIPTEEWKLKKSGIPWQLGETLSCVIGQSYILATPLQLALSYSAIANGGEIFRPFLVKEIFNNAGDITYQGKPQLKSKAEISEKTFEIIRKGLYEVVNKRKGTAWYRRGRGIEMAGKTGTSQVLRLTADNVYNKCEDLPYGERRHGVFVAFAPYRNPRIAVASIVEHGCHGSSAAAPVVEKVVTSFMKKYEPKLHEILLEEDKKMYRKIYLENKRRQEEKEKKMEEQTALAN